MEEAQRSLAAEDALGQNLAWLQVHNENVARLSTLHARFTEVEEAIAAVEAERVGSASINIAALAFLADPVRSAIDHLRLHQFNGHATTVPTLQQTYVFCILHDMLHVLICTSTDGSCVACRFILFRYTQGCRDFEARKQMHMPPEESNFCLHAIRPILLQPLHNAICNLRTQQRFGYCETYGSSFLTQSISDVAHILECYSKGCVLCGYIMVCYSNSYSVEEMMLDKRIPLCIMVTPQTRLTFCKPKASTTDSDDKP